MIGVLIFPEFQLLDAAGPISVFEVAKRYAATVPATCVMAAKPGLVRSSSGAEMRAIALPAADAVRTLIVAGGEGVSDAMRCARTTSFVQRVLKEGSRVASVCNGAYILAEAGLLNGRRATTHWSMTRDFIHRFPKVKMVPDQIFTRDGNVWTSAGISAGMDLALAIATEDYGQAVAHHTARQLVLYHRRSGGQSQFSSLLELKAADGRFGTLLGWIREHLDASLTVEDLAEQAGMSTRHFARAFAAETGTTPSKAIEKLRLEHARERVRHSGDTIERIARASGFGDAERMRRAFIRAFGHPPQSLRRAERHG